MWYRFVIYILFTFVAAATFIGRSLLLAQVRSGGVDPIWIWAPLVLLLLLLGLLALDALWHKKSSLYPIVIGVFLISLLLPPSLREFQIRKVPKLASENFFEELFESKDARIRTLVILALENTLATQEQLPILEKGLNDKDPKVKEACIFVIEKHAGTHLSDNLETATLKAKEILKTWSDN